MRVHARDTEPSTVSTLSQYLGDALSGEWYAVMRILVVGGGGREHALVWSLSRSPSKPTIFASPGNVGTSTLAQNVAVAAHDVEGLLTVAADEKIDLTIIGPEQPLVAGIVDRFEREGRKVVGPTASAARLEGSKVFSKAFMDRHGIPTAQHRTFGRRQYEQAITYAESLGAPVVVKASGLAAGKGAIVCESMADARDAVRMILEENAFGSAGDEVVVEAFMSGEEASVFALTDGEQYVLLSPAQDHKRIGEGDTGPNTGGMGAYAPAPIITNDVLESVCRKVIDPTLHGMREEGAPYRGFLYVGLMISSDGPRVVEYNCRLGDPEAQAILPLLDADTVDLFAAVAAHDLRGVHVRRKAGASACVVMASEGYPGDARPGDPILGIEEAEAIPGVLVFHAGTRAGANGEILTAGGRVLGVTAVADDLSASLALAYDGVHRIDFRGKQFRRDIGQKGVARLHAGAPAEG